MHIHVHIRRWRNLAARGCCGDCRNKTCPSHAHLHATPRNCDGHMLWLQERLPRWPPAWRCMACRWWRMCVARCGAPSPCRAGARCAPCARLQRRQSRATTPAACCSCHCCPCCCLTSRDRRSSFLRNAYQLQPSKGPVKVYLAIILSTSELPRKSWFLLKG